MSPSPPTTPKSPPNPKKGVFRNGRWLCNCDPRLDAVVRTAGTNKSYGKRFYSCAKYGQGNHCDMYLLVEEAKERAAEYILSNGRSEKRQTTLLESLTPCKGKGRLEEPRALAEISDPQTAADGASTSAIASTSKMAPQAPRSSNKSSSTAQSSTLKGSNEETNQRPEGFWDTTSDDDDDDDDGEDEKAANRRATGASGSSALPPSTLTATPAATQRAGTKRKQLSDEDLLDDLSSGAEEELLIATEMSSRRASALGTKQRDAFVTPSTTRTADVEITNGLPTPSLTKGKSVKKVLFQDEVRENNSNGGSSSSSNYAPLSIKRQRLNDGTGAAPTSHASRLFGTDATIASPPSPSPPPPQAAPTPSSTPGANLVSEVMGLLKDEEITAAVRREVRRTLEKYVGQAKGYELGREASRRAVKDAEDRAAALAERVEQLEASRRELRGKLMDLWNNS